MNPSSLAEVVLFSLEENSGIVPSGDLLERIEKSPVNVRRRLSRLDAEVFGLCGITPLEMGDTLTGLIESKVDDDGRIDTEAAWDAVVSARETGEPEAPDAIAERLLALAHVALDLESPCQACADWQPEDETTLDENENENGDDEDHDHEGPASLLERVFSVHADALDAWGPQVAHRVAISAGSTLADIAGFEALHQVVGHAGQIQGINQEQRSNVHVVQHVGMSLCADVAMVHALRAAIADLTEPDSVAKALEDAEQVVAQESGVLAAVIASVIVDRIAPMVEQALASAPPAAPPNRPAKKRRRR